MARVGSYVAGLGIKTGPMDGLFLLDALRIAGRTSDLLRILTEASSTLDLDRALNRTLALLNDAIGAEQGSILYVSDRHGRVQALDAVKGDERWRKDLDLDVSTGPGLGDDLVVIATNKGEVVALNRQDGKERWRAQVTSEVRTMT